MSDATDPFQNQPPISVSPVTTNPIAQEQASRSLVVTWLLALFVGFYGIDRFYLGRIWTGILKLVTFGGLGVWALIDVIWLAFSTTRQDKAGRPVEGTIRERKYLRVLTVIHCVFYVLSIIFLFTIFLPISQNTKHISDITSIQGGLKLYETNVSGLLPSSVSTNTSPNGINICGPSCQDGSAVSPLRFYNPHDVSIKTYQAGLQVPNMATVYIVANAACNVADTGLGTSIIHDMAILYDLKSIEGTKQHCADVPSYNFVDVDKAPYCGVIPSASMSNETYQFLLAKISKNKAQAAITTEMEAADNNSNPGIIDDQLVADMSFLSAIQKITYDSKTAPDVATLVNATNTYDNLISQVRQLERDNQPISNALSETTDAAVNTQSTDYSAVYADLGIPAPTCQFEAP